MTPMVIPFRYTKAQIDSTNEFTISVPGVAYPIHSESMRYAVREDIDPAIQEW